MKWLRYYMLSLLLLTGGIACAQYQQIGHPTKWILNYPIESLDPETGETGATLRKGLKLEVLLTLPDAWIVRPEQSHPGDPVLSIPIPDLSRHFGAGFASTSKIIQNFPLLMTFLESPEPWELRVEMLQEAPFKEETAWDLLAREVSTIADPSEDAIVSLRFWNNEDSSPEGVNPTQAFSTLTDKFSRLVRFFQLEDFQLPQPSAEVTAVGAQIRRFSLPNDLVATVSYRPRDSLSLTFESYQSLSDRLHLIPSDPYEIAERMKVKKWTPQGHLYLGYLPMMHRWDRRYAPTLAMAQVLQYYGYPVQMHRMLSLNQVLQQHSGKEATATMTQNFMEVATKFYASTPFQMLPIHVGSGIGYQNIFNFLEQGTPILWLTPGKVQLIMGIHPQTHEILYADSWETIGNIKTMPWDTFETLQQPMWVIGPR